MTSDQIMYFLEIAQCLNFSKAAENLNLSQSSLSKHIKNLEQEIGVALFNRTTRKISLSQAGSDFLSFAKILMDDYTQMTLAMRKHLPRSKTNIVLSSIPIMSIYRVTEMIAAFNEIHPEINIEIIEEDTVYVIERLREQKADIGLSVTNSLKDNNLHLFPFIDDDMVLIVHKNHRLAGREHIDLRETSGENFIFLGVETAMYNVCYDQCKRAGFEPTVMNTRQTNMQIETIIDFVSNGLGISIMMDKAAKYYHNPNFRIIRINETTKAHLAFLSRNERMTYACRMLLDFVVHYYGRN